MKANQKLAIGTKILSARVSGRPKPFFVQYSLLNACNSKCRYCDSPNRDDAQLDTDTHHRIVGEFARLGSVRVKFLGGEPLLRDDIGELIAEVNRLGMRSAMVTDGFLIPKKLDAVRRLDGLVISIDGNEEAHDWQRGRGTWKKVMKAVECCAREDIDFFLTAVVTRRSSGELDWLLSLARRLGVMVNFQMPQFNPTVYGERAREWLPEPDEIRTILTRIIEAKRSGAPVLFSVDSYRHTLEWRDFGRERDVRPGEVSPCRAGRYFIHMEPNGDVYPCVLNIGSFEPKNVVTDGVEAAWKHTWNHGCFDCYNTWLNENRAIFDLRPSVLLNFWQHYMRRRRDRAV
jgi:MoaA/NifB/PqqE/SkfB family radical SAM enzyme